MTSERRQNQRRDFGGWVAVHADGVRRLATGRDVSASGIGLVFDHAPAPAAAAVVCEFQIPGIQLAVELAGDIAWTDGQRAGVRFDAVDPALAELLDNHVEGRL